MTATLVLLGGRAILIEVAGDEPLLVHAFSGDLGLPGKDRIIWAIRVPSGDYAQVNPVRVRRPRS